MRGAALSLALVGTVLFTSAGSLQQAQADGKIRLAQTSTVTNCMMTCNSQAAACQTNCIVPGPRRPARPPPPAMPIQARPAS